MSTSKVPRMNLSPTCPDTDTREYVLVRHCNTFKLFWVVKQYIVLKISLSEFLILIMD